MRIKYKTGKLFKTIIGDAAMTPIDKLTQRAAEIGFGPAVVELWKKGETLPPIFWNSLTFEQCKEIYCNAPTGSQVENLVIKRMQEINRPSRP